MSNDWQPSDLALCVDDRPNPKVSHNGGLVCGRIYLVSEALSTSDGVGLRFEELADPLDAITHSFAAGRFIKVTPPELDEFDREVIDLMQKQGEGA